jgi:signal peptidase I
MEFLISVLLLVSMGLTFKKAGLAVWEGIVPFYNVYAATKVAGKAWWWALVIFIPVVGQILWALVCNEISKKFNCGIIMTVLLFFGIGFIYLGFAKKAVYIG